MDPHVTGPTLTVGRGVIADSGTPRGPRGPGRAPRRARRSGVARRLRRSAGAPSASHDDRVDVRLWVVARPGRGSSPLAAAGRARPSAAPSSGCSASSSDAVTVVVDGVGADRLRGRRAGTPDRRSRAIFEADFGQRTADAILERHLADSERDARPRELARELVASGRRAPRHASTPGSARSAPQYPVVVARPDGPRTAPMRPLARCYTPPRRPGWRSPSGSSWHAPTVESRCDV